MSILERHWLPQADSLKRGLEANIDAFLTLAPPIPAGNEVIKSKSLYLSEDVVKKWKDRPRIGMNDRMSPDELMIALRSKSPYQPAYELEYDARETAAILVPTIIYKGMKKMKSLSLHLFPQGIHETWSYRLELNGQAPTLTYWGEEHRSSDGKPTPIQGDIKRANAQDLETFSRFLSIATSRH